MKDIARITNLIGRLESKGRIKRDMVFQRNDAQAPNNT